MLSKCWEIGNWSRSSTRPLPTHPVAVARGWFAVQDVASVASALFLSTISMQPVYDTASLILKNVGRSGQPWCVNVRGMLFDG